jgi:hypothetical protein
MRHLATLLTIVILAAAHTTAQTTTNGALRQSSPVVTNEQDLVGIAFARTNLVMKIHNQANVNEWIDGAGNKYVVSNFWEMTFSVGFDEQDNIIFPPAQTSYTFTSPSQYFFERPGGQFAPYWRFTINGVYHFPGGFYNREWLPTTNALVLDPVVATGADGYVYIRAYSTTNIATLATVSQVAAKWQNPASATNWLWVSDGQRITLTNYTGSSTVDVPDMLDGLPVTTLNQTFSIYDEQQDEYTGLSITSVKGGANLKNITASTFRNCSELQQVDLNTVTNIGIAAFFSCKKLRDVNIGSIVEIGESAFDNCTNLTQITLPASLINIGPYAFAVREVPQTHLSVYYGGNVPTITGDPAIFDSRISVTNYVANPIATGWGSTFGGMPVVHMPVTIDSARNAIESLRDFHVDSYTNVIWKSVYSNGWMWLVAYTNYPAN